MSTLLKTTSGHPTLRLLLVFIISCCSFALSFSQPLNGTYTIGAGSPNYTTLTTAVSALITNGVDGPVIFNILPGTYTEHFTIPAISGASATNSITFQSSNLDSTSVIVRYNAGVSSANNYVIILNGAEHIHMKHFTIQPQSTLYQRGLILRSNASNNSFSNMAFKGTYAATLTPDKVLLFLDSSTGGSFNNNTIHHNRFENGCYQIRIEGSTIAGSSTGNNITDNYFTGNAGLGIYMSNQQSPIIAHNRMDGIKMTGVSMTNCNGSFLVEYNQLSGTGGGSALYIEASDATAGNPSIIRNNFLGSVAIAKGLNLSDVTYTLVVNNSINAYETAFYTLTPNIDSEVLNNIFNGNGGRCFYFYVPILPTYTYINHNAFYSTAAEPFRNGTVTMDLQAWNALGFDQASVFTDPQYVSSTNLHISNALLISDGAIPHPLASTDIDNEPRDPVHPDFGADEFVMDSLHYHNVEFIKVVSPDSTICTPSSGITVRIANHSAIPITSLIIEWRSFDLLKDSSAFPMLIPPYDTADILISPYTFTPNTLYEMDFQTSKPNGSPDNEASDNNGSQSYYHLGGVQIYERVISKCSTDTEIFIKKFPNTSILWSDGSTGNLISNPLPGTYSVTVTGMNGCTVTDSIIIN